MHTHTHSHSMTPMSILPKLLVGTVQVLVTHLWVCSSSTKSQNASPSKSTLSQHIPVSPDALNNHIQMLAIMVMFVVTTADRATAWWNSPQICNSIHYTVGKESASLIKLCDGV